MCSVQRPILGLKIGQVYSIYMAAAPDRPIQRLTQLVPHASILKNGGHARRQPLRSLEVLFRHGFDARSRTSDFPFPVRQRLWRPSIAGSVVYRGVFRDDTVCLD